MLVDLRWRVDNVPAVGDYLPYVRLADAWGSGWSQSGGFSYPAEQWQPGDTVLTRLSCRCRPACRRASTRLTAGFYSAGTQQNLPHLGPAGAFAGEVAPVTRLTWPAARRPHWQSFSRPTTSRRSARPAVAAILPGDNGALLGSSVERTDFAPGRSGWPCRFIG